MAGRRRGGLPGGRGRGVQLKRKLDLAGEHCRKLARFEPRDVGERHDVALLGRGEHGDRLRGLGHELPAVRRRLGRGQ